MTQLPSVTVIVLAYNEELNLGPMVRESVAWMAAHLERWEVLIVDDGSTDNTQAVAHSLAADEPRIKVLVHDTNQGMGVGMRTGIAASSCDYFSIIAGDGQHPTPELERLLPGLEEADIVTTYHENQRQWWRRFLSWGFRRAMKWACGIEFTLEGIYLFPRSVAVERIGLDTIPNNTFFFSFELIARALRSGSSVTVRPMQVRWRVHGQSKVATLGRIWRIWGEILNFRRRLKTENRAKRQTPG